MLKIVYFYKIINFRNNFCLLKKAIDINNINLFFLKSKYSLNVLNFLWYLPNKKIFVLMQKKNMFYIPLNYFTRKLEFCYYYFNLKKFKFTINFLLFLKFNGYFIVNINPKNPFIVKACYYYNIKNINIWINNTLELKIFYKTLSLKKKFLI